MKYYLLTDAFVVMYSNSMDEDPEPVLIFLEEERAKAYCKRENKKLKKLDERLGYYIRKTELKEK